MEKRQYRNRVSLAGLFLPLLLLGCGMQVEQSGPSNSGLTSLGWSQPNTSFQSLDNGTGLAFTPRIAVEPDGGGTAMAVWVERVDLDLTDSKPAVYHLYASRWDGTNWSAPVLIDTGSLDYDAWGPKVAMDNSGNAVVVWQQAAGTGSGCDLGVGRQVCSNVYAKRYLAVGGWQGVDSLYDPTGFNAANPDVAMAPAGGGTAMAVWEQFNPKVGSWQTAYAGARLSILSMAAYNGELYAGQGSAAGDGDVLQILTTGALPYTSALSFNGGQESIRSLAAFGDWLFAGQGDVAAGAGDVYRCDPTAVDNEGTIPDLTDEVTCIGGDWAVSLNTAGYKQVLSLYNYAGALYAGMGNGAGVDGDVLVCDPTAVDNEGTIPDLTDEVNCTTADWNTTPVFEGATGGSAGTGYETVNAMVEYNGFLYAGFGTSTGDGDIYYCHPKKTDDQGVIGGPTGPDDETSCTANDWYTATASFDGGAGGRTYETVSSLVVYNGLLYAGFGNTASDQDVWVCTPTLTVTLADGTTDLACQPSDWVLSKDFGGTYEEVLSLAEFGGLLYAGLGNSAGGDGDVWVCDPGPDAKCDPGDWAAPTDPFFTGTTYEVVNAMTVFDAQLYTGMGKLSATDGDILTLSASVGWQIQASRLSAGTWTLAPNPIDAANGSAHDPRVAMDNSGNAIAVFIQRSPGTCFAINTTVENKNKTFVNAAQITCTQDRLYANRFNQPTLVWNTPGPTKISPTYTTVSADNLGYTLDDRKADCYNMNIAGKDDKNRTHTDACVDISEVQLQMEAAGTGAAIVAFKTYEWNMPDESFEFGGNDDKKFRQNGWDGNNTFIHHEIHINTTRFSGGSGGTWGNPAASKAAIAQYFFEATRSSPLTGTVNVFQNCGQANNFTNAEDTDNLGSQIMNCNFWGLSLAMEPDGGGTAMLTAERYSSTNNLAANARYDVIAYRWTGTAWTYFTSLTATSTVTTTESGTPTDPDATTTVFALDADGNFGTNDAHSPQLSMDNLGNGTLVWTQKDGTGKWRIYSRRYCPAIIAGTTGCAAAGWSGATLIDSALGENYFEPRVAMEAVNAGNAGSVGNAMTVFNVMDPFLQFRIDATRWTPP